MEQPTEVKQQSLEQTLGMITLAIIIILVVIFWLIKPQVTELKDANAKVVARQNELNAKQQTLETMNALESEIKTKAAVVNKLNIVLPLDQPEAASLVLQMETMAKNAKVSFNSFVPETSMATEEYSESNVTEDRAELSVAPYNFSFTITGNYSSIKSYLSALEKNLRPIKISDIGFAAAEGEDPVLSATVSAETYYQK